MEAVGVTIGIPALFTTCVQCFEYFKTATTQREDYALLLLKLELEQERFLIWGEDIGIGNQDRDEQSLFDGNSRRQDLALRCMHTIRSLLEDAEVLKSKYGVHPVETASRKNNFQSLSSNALKRLRLRLGRSGPGLGILQKTKWAIHDAVNFEKLIRHLRDLITHLIEGAYGSQNTLAETVQGDIASMTDDIGQLRLLSEACGDTYPAWSDIARSAMDISEYDTENGCLNLDPLAICEDDNTAAAERLDALFSEDVGKCTII
ncbi:MAG: hypothetical protein Q9222_002561 [Ikaeria aurantiellina]